MPLPKKPFTPEAAYTQAAARCATAEYCLNDWRRKFQMKGLPPRDIERVLDRLVDEGFINEARFVRAYVHDKALYDRWGQLKIRQSLMLKRLAWYPFIQLGVVMIFVVVAIFALLTSKRAEQNKVWVGLSKETAHQLGTPISSLMAWQEILKESYPEDPLVAEMGKDVERLQLIADRFSKIGSLPEPVPSSLNDVIDHVIDYMDRRTSRKVSMVKELPKEDIVVSLNASLFEWVIENLCKNAVDAMQGKGSLNVTAGYDHRTAFIEVTDTGKGIARKNFKTVFSPGFTTKKRGWGLGLTLAKRIIEEYHGGRIFVKWSEIGAGTTFRIELPIK